ncbi:glycolipid transfer protein [Trichoplusia ni]|uniref:Glycolipid transfer protein n=1 Tax=Trichoplusia ni TaxID=7111 RepID=A0A7E5WQ50_TRINI|nr:glycolipid transfer protein [Trichoplusia ni]
MASTSKDENYFFLTIKHFPSVENGKVNIVKFLDASTDLVAVVERLGTVFAPVKFDMQGNIDKVKKLYKYDADSCLLELMLDEKARGKPIAAEGVLWLNRALLFFELIFKEVLSHLQANNYDVHMREIFTVAYEGSVKKYHNWVTQQIFIFICKMSPSLPQIMKSFEIENKVKEFEMKLEKFNIALNLVRCKIDEFFRDNNLFD